MTKLSRTQLLHKLTEDNLRVISLYEYFKTLKCDCELITETQTMGVFKGHETVMLHVRNYNGLTALTGTSEYNYTNCIGYLAVDFKKLFDKWSRVSMRISLDRTNEEIVQIMIDHNTKKHFLVSNSFGQVFWDA